MVEKSSSIEGNDLYDAVTVNATLSLHRGSRAALYFSDSDRAESVEAGGSETSAA